jgi:hypothetical protein
VQDVEYSAVVRRVRQISLVLAVAGVIGFAAQGNRLKVFSFLAGTAISSLSFYFLHRLVVDLGGAFEGKKPRGASFVLHAFRLVLLGGATFGIVKAYGASVSALAVGLLVPVTAITLEVLYELTYARD